MMTTKKNEITSKVNGAAITPDRTVELYRMKAEAERLAELTMDLEQRNFRDGVKQDTRGILEDIWAMVGKINDLLAA